MKTINLMNLSKGLISVLVSICVCSCSDQVMLEQAPIRSIKDVQLISFNDIEITAYSLAPIITKTNPDNETRAEYDSDSQLTPSEVKEVKAQIQPFVEVGAVVRDNIIIASEQPSLNEEGLEQELNLTAEERQVLQDMTDEDLAAFGLAISVAYEQATMDNVHFDSNLMSSYTTDKLLHCLGYATGINDIATIFKTGIDISCVGNVIKGTKGLISATTAKQIAFMLIKRYAGYIGIAWMIYDFGTCMSGN